MYNEIMDLKIKILKGKQDNLMEEILGYKSSKTTEIYIHVSTKDLRRLISPLDRLNLNQQKEVKIREVLFQKNGGVSEPD
jgi:hypothetical protein